jgi:hypothetical protein
VVMEGFHSGEGARGHACVHAVSLNLEGCQQPGFLGSSHERGVRATEDCPAASSWPEFRSSWEPSFSLRYTVRYESQSLRVYSCTLCTMLAGLKRTT